MRARAFATLLQRDLRRTARSLRVSLVGVALGIASLSFFLSLSTGLREGVLERLFPSDRFELERADDGITEGPSLSSLLEGTEPAPGISDTQLRALRALPGVRSVHPRVQLLFPTSGHGGRSLVGRDLHAGELIAEGIDPVLLRVGLAEDASLSIETGSGRSCTNDAVCPDGERCDVALAPDGAPRYPGQCHPPIPIVVSPFLVELFDTTVAPAHRLPPLGTLLLQAAQNLVFEWDLGRAQLGVARRGNQRRVHVRLAGVSPNATRIGFSVPLAFARQLNAEFVHERWNTEATSATVFLRSPEAATNTSMQARALGLRIRTTGFEQAGLLVTILTLLLSTTSVLVLALSAASAAQASDALARQRRGELGVLLALGATPAALRALFFTQTALLGFCSSSAGLLFSRFAAWGCDRLSAKYLATLPFVPEHWFLFRAGTFLQLLVVGVLVSALPVLPAIWRRTNTPPALLVSGRE